MTAGGRVLRMITLSWWLQLKARSRSAFDGLMSLLWPLFFATSVFFMFRGGGAQESAMLAAAMGASVMGVWSATSTTAAFVLQAERRQATLELLVAAPTPFPLVIVPITLSMATIGLYSLIVTLLFGRFVFGIKIAVVNPIAFGASILVTVIAVAMLGFLLAIGSVRYRTAWALGAALELPVWLICGFLVPLSALPDWVRPISWLLAPTWGMAAIRAAVEGGNAFPALSVCVAVAVAYAVVGARLCNVVVESARRHASLALS